MQFFCDVEKPDGQPFGGNCRGFLRSVNRKFKKLGITCNVGAECEFYLFENDDRGRPTRIPIDFGGYFDVAPLDAGENLRRDICLTMEQMGMSPQHSHHESGNGQNEIDCHHAGPLKTADNVMMFKQIVRAIATRSGIHASFLPKPCRIRQAAACTSTCPFTWMAATCLRATLPRTALQAALWPVCWPTAGS